MLISRTSMSASACGLRRAAAQTLPRDPTIRSLATVSPVTSATRTHKTLIIGGGAAGLSISHQLLGSGRFAKDDIAVVDPAEWHHYQPGWTLVGGGLKNKQELKRPLKDLVDPKIKFYSNGGGVAKFSPERNTVTLGNGDEISYEHLVVAPGIKVNFGSVRGLPEALADPSAPVSSIYGYDSVDKVFPTVEKFKKGKAIFTHPAGIIKCAGAPQKIMWLALDYWKKGGLYRGESPSTSDIQMSFMTGLPFMFAVPKYNAKLDELRQARGVEGLFEHDLVAVEGNTAIFVRPDGEQVKKHFDFLHAVPKMGPHEFVKNSPLGNEVGLVDVDDHTLRHKRYANVWSVGDASSLPNPKTAAAITAQVPVLARNMVQVMQGKEPDALYDGYASCPILTEYGKVLLAEFTYGGVPKETFGKYGLDQGTPRRAFYYLKKDFFPWVYYKSLVKGTWGGPKGWINPKNI
ncbi:Sulfide:quinone oxidoreductase [Escovopsis weberi]|uniref:Sulfide:quinone oxidoreductase n=1 Tax=Escovopsis weberi TaxID=150374 RepID=A0A0M8MUX7_ESCWE|nr:Sulfide:quinone oxidoreductase [Escovopsis weberi]